MDGRSIIVFIVLRFYLDDFQSLQGIRNAISIKTIPNQRDIAEGTRMKIQKVSAKLYYYFDFVLLQHNHGERESERALCVSSKSTMGGKRSGKLDLALNGPDMFPNARPELGLFT